MQRSRYTFGIRTTSPASRRASPSPPSRRPRGGSRARRAGCGRTGRGSRPPERSDRTACAAARRRRGGRAPRGRAPSRRRCRAAGSSPRRPRPSAVGPGRSGRSRRRRAAPSRSSAKTSLISPPSSASSTGRMPSTGSGATRFCSLAQLLAHVGRQAGRLASRRSDRASRRRRRPPRGRDGGAPLRARPCARRAARPTATGRSLRVARGATSSLYRRHTATRRLTARMRARRHDETGALANRQRSGPGEQVERHRDRHRRRDADGDDVHARGRRHPSSSRTGSAPAGTAALQPITAGEQRGAPPASRAEQAERQRGRRDDRAPRRGRSRTAISTNDAARTVMGRPGRRARARRTATDRRCAGRRPRRAPSRDWNDSAVIGLEQERRRRVPAEGELVGDAAAVERVVAGGHEVRRELLGTLEPAHADLVARHLGRPFDRTASRAAAARLRRRVSPRWPSRARTGSRRSPPSYRPRSSPPGGWRCTAPTSPSAPTAR